MKINTCVNLVCSPSRAFLIENALSLSISPHFPPLANRHARDARNPSANLPRLLALASAARSPWQPLPVCTQSRTGWRASEQTCMRATNYASVARAPRLRYALKKPHDRPTGKRGGGGAPGRALFSYNSSHPPLFFSAKAPVLHWDSPYLA